MSKRFRVAFSFAGDQYRDFVEKVADILTKRFTREAILYDKYHEAEFAEPNLAFTLPNLYKTEADLVVAVFCPNYERKDWCRLEWRVIYSIIKERDDKRVMLSRFERADGEGLHGLAGFVELDKKTPEEFASLVLERLAINEGKPRDHYKSATPAPGAAVPSAAITIPSNLPGGYIGRLFVGRDDFLDQLRNSLQKQTHATAITQAPAATGISGLGGMGKTHAAVEYAHRHRGDYTALLFICGHSPERLNASLAALCDVLHLNVQGGLPSDESARLAIALDWLATHRGWLLIVDNVDDEDAAIALTGYFARFASGHVLITSRLQNWTDSVEALNIEVLSAEDSIALLCTLTDNKRRHADDDAIQARRLAKLMEGLPLALHQAAGYIKEQRLTFAEYHVRYDEEAATLLDWFNKLTIPYAGPDELARRPVLITWKTSFDKLDADTRFWLLVFSHFAPDPIPEFLLSSASEADGEVKKRHSAAKKALAQAETYSLLTRDRDQPRFKLHRLVQHIIRLTAIEGDRTTALAMGIQLIFESSPGTPQDVRSWEKWSSLQSHGHVLCDHALGPPLPQRLSWLLNQLAMLLQTKALHTQAEPLYRRSLDIDEASYGPTHSEVAIRLNNLAVLLQDTNRLEEAEVLHWRVIKINEINWGKDHPLVATSFNNLAQLFHATNRLAESESLMRRALSIDEAASGPDHPTVSRDLNNLARLLHETNRLAEAEPLMRRALFIDEACYGSDHPSVAISLNNLATLLQATNRLAEAEPLMRRALCIDETCYGPEHPNVSRDLNNLARLLQDTNRLAEAELLMRRALGIHEASFGPSHPEVAIRLNNLAMLLQGTNQLEEAESLMRRALNIDENSYGNDHPNVAIRLNNLAQLLQATNRVVEAESLMQRVLRINEISYGPNHSQVAISLNNLATLLQATNRLAEAEPLMRRALFIDEACYGSDHPSVARCLNNLARLLQDTNRLTEAEPLMRRAFGIFLRSFGEDHPNSQIVGGNYVSLLRALRLPNAEILQRVQTAMKK